MAKKLNERLSQPRKECPRCRKHQKLKSFERHWVDRKGKMGSKVYDLCAPCRRQMGTPRNTTLVSYAFNAVVPAANNEYWPVGNEQILRDFKARLENEAAYS
ncbi:hypothetical protein GJV52_00910 [Neisseria brasiliensis]|uniref:Uncharacterized protein n=1 Tax=Neisseria brasiliensis TaxID=2666100 RepID=A0A5Q3S0A3_9NEIS|nr:MULTISPECIES: hypothetical protein [Neisseria]MRN37227.1 hypothetical protein [Neisseria brasiliensis]QGL24238.1 hypothetical protein GJV52_00910 [Neisseria brasiliensis]